MEHPGFAHVRSGREHWRPGERIPRHRHREAYAAIVLAGGYEECGSGGRFRVSPGDVLIHPRFDAHLDRFSATGASILNLALPDVRAEFTLGRIADPDAIVRLAERDLIGARRLLAEQMRAVQRPPVDWPDALARRLSADPACRLDVWAREQRLSPETLSRGFGSLFGITPAAFRCEARARRAVTLMDGSRDSLAEIAATAGFADQAHMTRAVRALTGEPPTRLMRSNPFKTTLAPSR
jgi:AraC-like DNA-binding protein